MRLDIEILDSCSSGSIEGCDSNLTGAANEIRRELNSHLNTRCASTVKLRSRIHGAYRRDTTGGASRVREFIRERCTASNARLASYLIFSQPSTLILWALRLTVPASRTVDVRVVTLALAWAMAIKSVSLGEDDGPVPWRGQQRIKIQYNLEKGDVSQSGKAS